MTTRGPMFRPSSGLPLDLGDFPRPDAVPCVVGEPAHPRLLQVHHRPFVNAFWGRMLHAIEHPVEVDESLGMRRVQVLGQVIYAFLVDGTVAVQAWRSPALGPTVREPIDPGLVAVEHTPFGDRWLALFQEGFRFEVQRVVQVHPSVLDAYTRWILERVRYRVRHDCDLRAMRRDIAAALALDPRLVALARRLPEHRRSDGVVTLAGYNAAARRRAAKVQTQPGEI